MLSNNFKKELNKTIKKLTKSLDGSRIRITFLPDGGPAYVVEANHSTKDHLETTVFLSCVKGESSIIKETVRLFDKLKDSVER